MCLVGVRSTSPDAGLVAILVERGGPGMLAVPVGVREGLSLAAGEVGPATSWTGLMGRCAEAAGTRLSHVRLDVDDDARLCARVVLEPVPRRGLGPRAAWCVDAAPGDALVLAGALGLDIRASSEVLRLRGVDLGEEPAQARFERWRMELASELNGRD